MLRRERSDLLWLLRHRHNKPRAFLFTRSTRWLNGADLRREVRKATLNEHMEYREGGVVFQHACKMGLEGIVWIRLGSRYRSGRSPDWLNFKNPDAPAGRREAEEDWGR